MVTVNDEVDIEVGEGIKVIIEQSFTRMVNTFDQNDEVVPIILESFTVHFNWFCPLMLLEVSTLISPLEETVNDDVSACAPVEVSN